MKETLSPSQSAQAEALRLLVRSRLITQETLDRAAARSARTGKSVGLVLMEEHHVARHSISYALDVYYSCPFLGYDEHLLPSAEVARRVSADDLKSGSWVALRVTGATVHVLTHDPLSYSVIESVQKAFPGLDIRLYVGLPEDVMKYIDAMMGVKP